MDATDHELMLAVRAGQTGLLGELFERHHRRLYAYLLQLTRDGPASEDIVQTVFQRILQYRHTYRDEGNFAARLYHLGRTAAFDCFRKNKIARQSENDTAAPAALPDDDASPSDTAERADNLALLQTALARPAVEDREILHLAHIENRPHRDTARILACSEGAVKVRAHRALQQLRDTYRQLCQPANPELD